MKKFFTIYLFLTTVFIFAQDYNCRIYKDINISNKNINKYTFNEAKKNFHKKNIFFINENKIEVEHYDYEGVFNKNDTFDIRVFDNENNLIIKKELNKDIYKFQAIKKEKKIIVILEIANKKGSNIEIISFDKFLNFNEIYKIEGRENSFNKYDRFTLGDITFDKDGNFIVAIQLSIWHSAKFTKNYGELVKFYKFDKNNKLVWKKKLEIPEGIKFEISDNNLVYIEGNYLYTPLLFNNFTSLKNINGCYLINNDIANLYGYYAIDSDGYFWTKDPNQIKKVKEFLFPPKREMTNKDWFSFIGFLLFILLYFIYKKRKK